MVSEKRGRVVWHDLFTKDLDAAKAFYAAVGGWQYMSEHADDYTWGGGEKDHVLTLRADEAGAGLVERSKATPDGWMPYVEVEDVDSAASLAADLGGAVVRPPFDVPGVGRNCLIRDPLGASLGLSLSRHGFPPPTRQFGPEFYMCKTEGFPDTFYRRVLGWTVEPERGSRDAKRAVTHKGVRVATFAPSCAVLDSSAQWIPSVRTEDLSEALSFIDISNGEVLDRRAGVASSWPAALVRDPGGAALLLIEGQA